MGAALVAVVEAHESTLSARTASALSVAAADFAVLAPVAIAISLAFGLLHVYLEPRAPRSPSEILAAIRAEPVLAESRTAAIAPLAVVASFVGTLVIAHGARDLCRSGVPRA